MIDVPMNVNALSYYGTATTTSGSTAIGGATALPDFDKVENIVFNNESADFIAVKTGTSTVTVAFDYGSKCFFYDDCWALQICFDA